MCKDQLCVKHAKFLMSHMPIFDQCTNKHNTRVLVKTFFFLGGGGGGGGSWRVWGGGKLPPQ